MQPMALEMETDRLAVATKMPVPERRSDDFQQEMQAARNRCSLPAGS